MGNNYSNLRELPDIQNPLLLFKNLKTDLDKLKSQIDNLKNIKLSSKLLHGISLKNCDLPDVRSWNTPEADSAKTWKMQAKLAYVLDEN